MNVVFLIFNRPDVTARVWERIREARPDRLFVVADGPRADRPGEAEKVAAARAITERVDWQCDVTRDYSDENLGCARRVSSGITNAFDDVDEAIILEDDCVPHPTFFHWCEAGLQHFRADTRIMHLSGTRFPSPLDEQDVHAPAVYFSKYAHMWGWATWRRAWLMNDDEIKCWANLRMRRKLLSSMDSDREREVWSYRFGRVQKGEIDTWAWRWQLNVWHQSGLSVVPPVNLVQNIGFGPEATHTPTEQAWQSLPSEMCTVFEPPAYVLRDIERDRYQFMKFMGGNRRHTGRLPRICAEARRRIRTHLGAFLSGTQFPRSSIVPGERSCESRAGNQSATQNGA